MKLKRIATLGALLVAMAVTGAANAADKLVFATTGSGAWDSSVVEYGRRMGFFEEAGIDIQYAVTESAGLSLQAIIAGSADVGSVAVHTFLAAAIQGAPVKMVSSFFRGSSDFLWYTRSDNPLQSFADLTEDNVVGVTSMGASQYIILRTLLDQYGVNPQVVAVGTSAAGMTQVMTGQIDVGTDGNGLLGVPQYASGDIRPLAYGSEADVLRDVTVRGLVVTENTLAQRRDVVLRFLATVKRTIEWMYADPQAVQWFAERTGTSVEEALRVREQSYPEGVLHLGDIRGLEYSIEQGLQYKRIDRAPTAEEVARAFEILLPADE